MINKTLLIAIALVGVVLISGCIGTTQSNTNNSTNNQTITADQVANTVSQDLISENQTTVEIGDMV